MNDLLKHYPIYFPRRHEQLYTIKRFLNTSTGTKHQLPIIVNITSLNNYGRAVRNLLSKNTQLLLIGIYELDSILAEYHPGHEGRHLTHRHRLTHVQGKKTSRATSKLRSVKKLSKSLASLTPINQANTSNHGDDLDDENNNDDNNEDDEDEKSYHERSIFRSLHEKRSSIVPFCRVPMYYRKHFEVLNEDDQAVEPYHHLTDLIPPEYPNKSMEKWPKAFFLRSPCIAYTQKNLLENDQKCNSMVSNDSCYSSLLDLDSQKSLILLNDDVEILQPGQALNILGECLAIYMPIGDREFKEQLYPSPVSSPAPSTSSTSSWFRDKSRIFFPKRRRRSQNNDANISHEILPHRSISKTCEPYLKCQTQHGNIVFIHLHESGLFSPLNSSTSHATVNMDSTRLDVSCVYQLKHLLSIFRFPFSVRHLDGSVSFENSYTPAVINRHESATKFRLLTQYTENVVFACPINLVPSKSSKTSLPLLVLPLPINADIEIQPCTNMTEISKTEDFQKLIEHCFHLIEQYRNEISLIHFPLKFSDMNNRKKKILQKQRSRSVTDIGYFNEDIKHSFRRSNQNLNRSTEDSIDQTISSGSSPLRCRDSVETVQQRKSADTGQLIINRSDYHTHKNNDRYQRYSQDDYGSEDEMYRDVDKIYDYIRSGDITPEVQKIQAKERIYHGSHTNDTRISPKQLLPKPNPAPSSSPGKMVTHRFNRTLEKSRSSDPDSEFYSCKNDRNVDDEQAHALYIAAKQRTKPGSPDVLNSKTLLKFQRINKQ